jgi:hypothetical protein
MRFANLCLGILGLGALATAAAAGGCGGGSGGTGGSTGATTGPGGPTTCEPTAACAAVDKTCLGLVNNTGKTTFGLRMAELDLTAPAALTTGIVKTTVQGDVGLDLKPCNLLGSGTFSWLLEFDTTAGTLKTGCAKPVTDPTMGYAFDMETINGFTIAPVTYTGITPDSTGAFNVAMGQDLIVPIFLDAAATEVVLLPLKAARLTMGTLSASQNCIGSYNGSTLTVANSCQPVPPATQFTDGASLDGYITLEDADTVIVSVLNESLCVLLSDASDAGSMPGDGGINLCERDANGNIVFQGNWCASTNSAATSTCFDSVTLGANFAASSVLITN